MLYTTHGSADHSQSCRRGPPVSANTTENGSILSKMALSVLRQVYRNLAEIPGGQLDVVNVFRRPQDIPQHMGDIIAAKPKVVWLQTGITNEAAEEKIAAQGMRVVSDRCLMVDRQRALARL